MTEERKDRRRRALQYPSTLRGRVVPTSTACTILDIKIDRIHQLIRAGNLPAFYYDKNTNLVLHDPMQLAPSVPRYFFYEGDLYAYAERRDAYFASRRQVGVPKYSQEQSDQVVAIADQLLQKKGYVNRTEVLDLLLKEQKHWRREYYPIVREVLADTERWPAKHGRG